METKKIICADWIGRFGNRCHSYLYGKHIEDKFGIKFYIPSEWEGSYLFENPAEVAPEFSKYKFSYAGGSEGDKVKFNNNSKVIEKINKDTNDTIQFIDPCRKKNYGKCNISYISLVTDAPWFFPQVSLEDIKKYFCFNEAVKNTDLYKELSELKGTYDVAHFRRTDIAHKNYKGGHSMVSKSSYYSAFNKFNQDPNNIIWISDEPSIGWKYKKTIPKINGQIIKWLPDFLKLMFARRIFRSNSSFSLFGSWLSEGDVFAPLLHSYAPGKEIKVDFVEGNYPHWMAVKGVHTNFLFDLKGERNSIKLMENKTKLKAKVKVKPKNVKDKIVMVHWNGRFGNRLGSYAFGRSYAEKYNLDFYIPSVWEGSILFKDKGYKIIDDDTLRLKVNQTSKEMDSLQYRSHAINEYCGKNKHLPKLTYMNPDDPNMYGNKNVFFDSLAVNGPHIFKDMSRKKILEWYEFTDEIKKLDVYKILEDKQGTYDIAHLRRDDISSPTYNKNNHQGYSVISKQSYLNAFKKFGFDVDKMEWTTDDWTGKWGVGKPAPIRGGWSYPMGSHKIPDIIFDWLPDFLRLYFARTIFRANSSFSWWAAFLSKTAKVYSPVLTKRKIYFSESDEVQFDFVEGNDPHWLNYVGNPKKLAEKIIIPD